jgi:hypothetical protein
VNVEKEVPYDLPSNMAAIVATAMLHFLVKDCAKLAHT